MSIEPHQITVGGLRIDVVLANRSRTSTSASIRRTGVFVSRFPSRSATMRSGWRSVSRMRWIKRQRAKFEAQARQSERDYVSGESHFYWGSRYRLNVIEGGRLNRICLRNSSSIDLFVRAGSDQPARERAFQNWYRQELRVRATPLIDKWSRSMQVSLYLPGASNG